MDFTEMERQSQETEDRYSNFARRNGLRPSEISVCPRVVIGRRCQIWRGGEQCICQRHHWALDHGRSWLEEGGGHVVTGEPYGFHAGNDLEDLLRELEELGVSLLISGDSPHYPGYTVLLRFDRS